jgi:hypothetical protein
MSFKIEGRMAAKRRIECKKPPRRPINPKNSKNPINPINPTNTRNSKNSGNPNRGIEIWKSF